MVLATKLVIGVAAALGLAVPLTTSIQKSVSATADPLLGRWNRHVNGEVIDGFSQYLELKSGGRYSFGTIINGRTVEEGFGSWQRQGDKLTFRADPKSKQAMLLEEAELVDKTMLRFSPLHAFCKRAHPHGQVLRASIQKPSGDPQTRFIEWLNRQPDKSWQGKYCALSYEPLPGEFRAALLGDSDKAWSELIRLFKSHGLDANQLEKRGKLLLVE